VRRAIRVHRSDFIAIAALVVLAVVVIGYILEHQPAFTFGQSYYVVKADFQTGAAVTSGQGQTVDIAGVEVGLIGGIQLKGGQAIVTMDIFKKYAPIYRNATVLLRPRTPLKDMYLSLDPGTPSAGRIPNGGTLGAASTQPDVDVDQILDSLDADTRSYLLLLLAGGAQAFENGSNTGPAPSAAAVTSLRGTFKRFAPLNRDTLDFTQLLSERSANLHRAIHNLDQVVSSVGDVDGELTSLIRASNTNFTAISSQDAELQQGLSLLPGTLQQTSQTLGAVQQFAAQSGPALQKLEPFARTLAPALSAAQPLFLDTLGAVKNQLRPFSTAVQPLARTLRPAALALSEATPKLVTTLKVLNALFNTLAYQKPGGPESYLFWGSWLAHITASLTNTQDAEGPIVRGVFIATCSELDLFEVALTQSDPALGPLVDLLNPPPYQDIDSTYCPAALP
jgi:phospholipid/cholesterol/gamma-HCH transport system substrate-binding protein